MNDPTSIGDAAAYLRASALEHLRHEALGVVAEADFGPLLGCTEREAVTLRKLGVGPRYVLVGRRVLYPLTAVREWLENLDRCPSQAAKPQECGG